MSARARVRARFLMSVAAQAPKETLLPRQIAHTAAHFNFASFVPSPSLSLSFTLAHSLTRSLNDSKLFCLHSLATRLSEICLLAPKYKLENAKENAIRRFAFANLSSSAAEHKIKIRLFALCCRI